MIPGQIKVIVADDNRLLRELLVFNLTMDNGVIVAGEAEDGSTAVALTFRLKPDVVIMDIDMPVFGGIEATAKIKREMPSVKIVALTMHSSPEIVKQMLEAGASGYLSKNCDPVELSSAIRIVHSGNKYLSEEVTGIVIDDYVGTRPGNNLPDTGLSERELEILRLIVDGMPVSSIAGKLFVSVKTVNSHRQNILEKLQLRSTADLVKYAIKKGIISIYDID